MGDDDITERLRKLKGLRKLNWKDVRGLKRSNEPLPSPRVVSFSQPADMVLQEHFSAYVGHRITSWLMEQIRMDTENLLREWLAWDGMPMDDGLVVEQAAVMPASVPSSLDLTVWASSQTHEWLREKGVNLPIKMTDFL